MSGTVSLAKAVQMLRDKGVVDATLLDRWVKRDDLKPIRLAFRRAFPDTYMNDH